MVLVSNGYAVAYRYFSGSYIDEETSKDKEEEAKNAPVGIWKLQ